MDETIEIGGNSNKLNRTTTTTTKEKNNVNEMENEICSHSAQLRFLKNIITNIQSTHTHTHICIPFAIVTHGIIWASVKDNNHLENEGERQAKDKNKTNQIIRNEAQME